MDEQQLDIPSPNTTAGAASSGNGSEREFSEEFKVHCNN